MSAKAPIDYLTKHNGPTTCAGCKEKDQYLAHWHWVGGKKRRFHRGGCCPDPTCWEEFA